MSTTANKLGLQKKSSSSRCPNKKCSLALFRSVDNLFLVFLLLTSVLLILSRDQCEEIFFSLLYIRVGIFLFVLFFLYLNTFLRHWFVEIIRKTYPILLSGYFYSETAYYNKYFFVNFDPFLEKLEFTLFNLQPSIEFSKNFSHLLFSELMYFGYFSFYLLIISFTLYVLIKEKAFSDKAIFLLSASLYLFYFLFALFPSEGPQFYFSISDRILPNAYFFDKVMHFIQKTAEQPTGAFPSSHVGISLIILMISRKKMPLFFKIACPFVIVLIFSTVYIKAHYVIDVFGGIIIAPIILYLSHFLYNLRIKKSVTSI